MRRAIDVQMIARVEPLPNIRGHHLHAVLDPLHRQLAPLSKARPVVHAAELPIGILGRGELAEDVVQQQIDVQSLDVEFAQEQHEHGRVAFGRVCLDEQVAHAGCAPARVAGHEIAEVGVLRAREGRVARDVDGLAEVDERSADAVPCALTRQRSTLATFSGRLVHRQQLLADLIRMLVEEPMQDDRIRIIMRRARPLLFLLSRRRCILLQR